ncbi:hypothetical protein BH11BAC6_BH11BAC6_11710 [soil metagenome]
MKRFVCLLCFVQLYTFIFAQHKTENVVIVTLDGMRWQEVFKGADSAIIVNKTFTTDSSRLTTAFWSDNINERRKKLFPFLWNTIAQHGQIYGNRTKGSNVNNANPYKFSYPGYNEIFTGYPDTAVNSNDKIANKNENVLEFINKQKGYTGKVAAFASWDVFPYILNIWRSGIYVNADADTLKFTTPELKLINDMQVLTAKPLDLRPDVFTYFAAREYLKTYKPKVLYIAFDETDDYAHEGRYDQYLKSANAQDAMINDLWNILQSMPEYKNKTTLIITCDHGRGDAVKTEWTSHGENIKDAGQIWIAAIGPNTKPTGEATNTPLLYQAQLATTLAALLGFDFKPVHPTMPVIASIIK